MLFVVCYDISEDAVRQKMAHGLLDFGTRIQESVYECLLDGELYDRMVRMIGMQKLAASDRVRVYQVCARCVEQVVIIGPGERASVAESYVF